MSVNPKQIEMGFRDILLALLYDVPQVIHDSDIVFQRVMEHERHGRRAFSYEVEEQREQGVYTIHYQRKKLALVTRRPHRHVVMYPHPNYLATKIFERVMWTWLPSVKLEVRERYHE